MKERFNFRRPEVIKTTDKRERERGTINFRPLKNIFYVLCLLFLFYILIFSNIFKVKKVEVNGVKSVEISDFLEKSLIGKNILLMQTGKFLHQVTKTFPILEEATLTRGLPSTVKIAVKERSQVMIFCSAGGCYEIDSHGYAYQKISRPDGKIILIDEKNLEIKDNEKIFSDGFISFYLDALDEFGKMGVKLKDAKIEETSFKVKFETQEGWSAILDSSANLNNQMSAIKQVLDNNKSDLHEYIDVRVEGVAYIK